MKKIALEIKLGDTIKCPHSGYIGFVKNIIDEGGKKIWFNISYTLPSFLIGKEQIYAFIKTTKVNLK